MVVRVNYFESHLQDAVAAAASSCRGMLDFKTQLLIIIGCCLLGLLWAYYNMRLVQAIDVHSGKTGYADQNVGQHQVSPQQKNLLIDLGDKISNGAYEFLKQQYLICIGFAIAMFIIIIFLTEQGIWTAITFMVGALISILCGSVGMIIATQANFRTTFCAKHSVGAAFKTAYRAGCSMGFALVSVGLLVLAILILLYKIWKGLDDQSSSSDYFGPLFEAIAGYGLGGSFVALFGRVGGGIYTKAADVGADLVGKVQAGLDEDSPRNPATIADNVGDNVGDVAGMSADLFGSFAQSTCAAFVMSSTTLIGSGSGCQYYISNLMYPLLIIAFGIFLCFLVSTLSTHCITVTSLQKVQSTLKLQLILSTILLLGGILAAAWVSYPSNFELRVKGRVFGGLTPWLPYLCSIAGLVSGLIIAAVTEYVTSHSYGPVRQLAQSCKSGPASNVTIGLALGYLSTFIPVILIAATAFLANQLLGYYGVALAALGMLANLPLGLAIDGYGPISDNAGGIAQMALMGPEVRTVTDGLDAAGNTTAAIGKGFAIGSACLVALSLYGGFLHNAGLQNSTHISLTEPSIFTGLLVGAMIPYLFSSFTIKSVGKAAQGMVEQVRRQIRQRPGILNGTVEPDYQRCIAISTRASLKQMIIPGLLVILTPLFIGFVFGPKMLAGFLPGAIVSGVQLAISAANTGGAWDNAKKYIQSGGLKDDHNNVVRKGSQIHKAAVVGDTVGDPLKDTSGPSLNILIKLMAIISLIFGSKFAQIHPVS